MGIAAIALAALLGFVCILIVARPFLRIDDADDTLDQLDAVQRDRLELLEARDRAITALQDLEVDHREGKVSDVDYRTLVSQLRGEAARAIAAIDAAREEADGGASEAGAPPSEARENEPASGSAARVEPGED
jgi:hypothetical protein